MTAQTRAVLILDDDETVRESLQDFFEDRGWLVTTAESAEEAIEMASSHRWAGAVVDIRLPGMDGTEFIREVRKSHPDLACVIYTGSPGFSLPGDLIASGGVCNTVMNKPAGSLFEMEKELIRLMVSCRQGVGHE